MLLFRLREEESIRIRNCFRSIPQTSSLSAAEHLKDWKRSSRTVPTLRRSALIRHFRRKKTEDVGAVLKQVLPQDFIKFGMIPELMGRVPVIVSLNPLDRDTLIRILQEPKNSIVKQYKKLFELDGVDLEFDDGAIEAIADKTLERKTGARGLRAIMEQAMMDLMYRIPSDDTIASCGVTKEVIEGTGEPILTHKEKTAAKPRGRRFKNGVEETA